MSIIIH